MVPFQRYFLIPRFLSLFVFFLLDKYFLFTVFKHNASIEIFAMLTVETHMYFTIYNSQSTNVVNYFVGGGVQVPINSMC